MLTFGWAIRCVGLWWDHNTMITDTAGILFFTTSCLFLMKLFKNFHEQRSAPGSVYRSLKFTIVGYNVLFYLVDFALVVSDLVHASYIDLIIGPVLSVLFGASYLLFVVVALFVLFKLRFSWTYMRPLFPPLAVVLVALLFRAVVNFMSLGNIEYSDTGKVLVDVTDNNSLVILITEALPGVCFLIMSLYTDSPWDAPGMNSLEVRRSLLHSSPPSSFRSLDISTLPKEALVQKEVVGQGSTGTVFKCEFNHDSVAVKILEMRTKDMTPNQTQALVRELSVVASLDHPNIVQVVGISYPQMDQVALVTEYFENGSLNNILSVMHRDLPFSLLLRMAQDIARGMAHLHKHGVVHHDLKTSNVLVSLTRQCRIADAGLWCLSQFEVSRKLRSGTLEYMAPEVLGEHEYSFKSDVYSFGVIFYEIVTGKRPFSECMMPLEAMASAIIDGTLTLKPPTASHPQPICDLMMRCMARNPDLRPTFTEIDRLLTSLYNTAIAAQTV